MKSFPKSKQTIVALAIFGLLIFLHSMGITDPIERTVFGFFSPIQKYLYGAGTGVGIFLKNLKFSTNNSGETEILKAQIRTLLVQNAKMKIYEEENKILKKELKFAKNHEFQYLPARVMGYDSIRDSSLIILEIESDAQDADGLKIGMPIVADDGLFIGKISHIKDGRVFGRLSTSPQSATAATILNKNYTAGVAEGELNLSIKMKMIPLSEDIKQGDLIVTSGLEMLVPKGLLIGTVEKIDRDPQLPFNTALINQLYDARTLSNVLIIKTY